MRKKTLGLAAIFALLTQQISFVQACSNPLKNEDENNKKTTTVAQKESVLTKKTEPKVAARPVRAEGKQNTYETFETGRESVTLKSHGQEVTSHRLWIGCTQSAFVLTIATGLSAYALYCWNQSQYKF